MPAPGTLAITASATSDERRTYAGTPSAITRSTSSGVTHPYVRANSDNDDSSARRAVPSPSSSGTRPGSSSPPSRVGSVRCARPTTTTPRVAAERGRVASSPRRRRPRNDSACTSGAAVRRAGARHCASRRWRRGRTSRRSPTAGGRRARGAPARWTAGRTAGARGCRTRRRRSVVDGAGAQRGDGAIARRHLPRRRPHGLRRDGVTRAGGDHGDGGRERDAGHEQRPPGRPVTKLRGGERCSDGHRLHRRMRLSAAPLESGGAPSSHAALRAGRPAAGGLFARALIANPLV